MTTNIGTMTAEQTAAAQAAVAAANAKNGVSASSGTGTDLSGDFSFFLKMLTTQLTNQDPTQPMDTSQMTQQIAQFSGVQQQVATNTKLDTLIGNNQQSQQATAVGYMAHEVESEGNTGEVYGGQGAFAYVLPQAASAVTVTIKNGAGETVFSGNGTTNQGRNILVWDGVNSSTGEQEPDGSYTISISAQDSSGAAITADTRAVGIVTGVESDTSGNVILDTGTSQMKLSDVLAVRTPSRVDLSSSDSGSDGTSS